MIALTDLPAFVHALAGAREVSLTAYTLRPGEVLDALEAAARRGAAVSVRLEADPLDDAAGTLHADNAASLARLRAAGARAQTTASGDAVLHMKAAVVDGVAWLDDRNWAGAGPEHVIRDTDGDDVAAVAGALAGGSGADAHLATVKAGALRLEAAVVAAAGTAPLDVESESFGSGLMYDRLLERARAGRPTRLIVSEREYGQPGNARERAEIAHLQKLGTQVRIGQLDEKLAVGGAGAWIGSANATYARGAAGAQHDWGMATRDPDIVDGLRAAFEANWRAARDIPA